MLVGALADAGASQPALLRAIDSLETGAVVSFEKVTRAGIAAIKFHVAVAETHRHRHLHHILELIDRSALSDRAKKNAGAIFTRLGEVEAAVHQVPIERVHFHEVGAATSIEDMVGASAALNDLAIDTIFCSALNVGSGTLKTEHGVLPVPAPATAALVQGKPVFARGPAVELTTPTGAAVVTTLARGFGAMPPMRI